MLEYTFLTLYEIVGTVVLVCIFAALPIMLLCALSIRKSLAKLADSLERQTTYMTDEPRALRNEAIASLAQHSKRIANSMFGR